MQEMARDNVTVRPHVPHLVPPSHMGCVSNVSPAVCTFVSTIPTYNIHVLHVSKKFLSLQLFNVKIKTPSY